MQQRKGRSKSKQPKEKPEFEQTIIDLARVTRVTKGGKQLSFRACVLIGDRKGRIGFGVDKGKDVQIAVEKAVNQARKHMIVVPMRKDTLPHRVEVKYKAARVMLKPAPRGSGIIAGSVIRSALELAGVANASAKMLGKSNNKIANLKAAFLALQSFKVKSDFKPRVKEEEVVVAAVAPVIIPEIAAVASDEPIKTIKPPRRASSKAVSQKKIDDV